MRFAVRLSVHERHESYPDCGLKPFSNNMWEPVKTKARTWQTCKGKLVIIASEWSKSSTCAVSPMALKQDKQKSIYTLDKTNSWLHLGAESLKFMVDYFSKNQSEVFSSWKYWDLVSFYRRSNLSFDRLWTDPWTGKRVALLVQIAFQVGSCQKNWIFSKGTERERFLGLYASRFLSS